MSASSLLTGTMFCIKGPWTPKFTYPFPKRAEFSDNFDGNFGTQHFVNTEKLYLQSTICENDAENVPP